MRWLWLVRCHEGGRRHRWDRLPGIQTERLGIFLGAWLERKGCRDCGALKQRTIEWGGFADDTVGPWVTT